MQEGSIAPDFSLKDQDGRPVSLADYRGQWIVLYFYPKDNTSGCTKEACDFTDLRQQYQRLGAKVIGVSRDSVESHQGFIAKQRLDLTLLSDPEAVAHRAYGSWGVKKMYGKESEGVIRSTFLINPEGVVVKSWKNVKVRTKKQGGEVRHADVVAEALRALQS